MEEFVWIGGSLCEMHMATDITGLTEDELRSSRGYVCIDTTPEYVYPDEYNSADDFGSFE
jgi:hypothetical protein